MQSLWENLKFGIKNFKETNPHGIEMDTPAVELDECLFTHLNGEQVWCFGIYDRFEKFPKIFVVGNDRSEEKLLPLILENIGTNRRKRTRVYTDGWLAYRNL